MKSDVNREKFQNESKLYVEETASAEAYLSMLGGVLPLLRWEHLATWQVTVVTGRSLLSLVRLWHLFSL